MDLQTKMDGSDRVVTITVDFGESREEGSSLDNLSAALMDRGVPAGVVMDVIAGHAIANLKVYFRAAVKAGMKGGKDTPPLTDEEIQAKVDKMAPTVPSERTPAVHKLVNFLVNTGKYTKEQAEDILADPEKKAKLEEWMSKLNTPDF